MLGYGLEELVSVGRAELPQLRLADPRVDPVASSLRSYAKTSLDVPDAASRPVKFVFRSGTRRHNEHVTRVVHVPYAVEQDEDGVWCASAQLRPGVGAVGDGATQEEAIADLRTALEALLDVVGPPDELTLTLNVA
jgi:predicted RNase H-like HicB family nuclease